MDDELHFTLPMKYVTTTNDTQPPILELDSCIHQSLPSSFIGIALLQIARPTS
jgi:hypothetical protein